MTTVSPQTRQLLPYALLKGKSDSALRERVSIAVQSPRSITELLNAFALSTLSGIDEQSWHEAQIAAERQVEKAHELDVQILSPFDDPYPKLLASTHDFPLILWVKGSFATIPQRSVAVIGPREPTRHGALIASRIADFFAGEGWSVVSGLALGCDTAAHRATLDAGGHTIAVLAHGLQTISPKANEGLAERIIQEGGALLSEFPLGATPHGKAFVQRDRTQAGLSRGVVMVQSDLTGGSLHAPRAALSYRRWVAVPYPTNTDLADRANKIQANMVLASDMTDEKAKLMRCSSEARDRIIVLRSKDDYQRLTVIADDLNIPDKPKQHALL